MIDHSAIHLALRARMVTASGIPAAAQRAWTNKSFTPTVGTRYLEEEFVVSPPQMIGMTDAGTLRGNGYYIIKIYEPEDDGAKGAYTVADAILGKLSSRTRLTLSNGDVVRIGGNPIGPCAGQLLPLGTGFAVCTITVPWWILTANAVAA